jgi:hypothetical protein
VRGEGVKRLANYLLITECISKTGAVTTCCIKISELKLLEINCRQAQTAPVFDASIKKLPRPRAGGVFLRELEPAVQL